MVEYPNDASRKSKAEGDRWSSHSDAMRGSTGGRGDDAIDMDLERDDRRSER